MKGPCPPRQIEKLTPTLEFVRNTPPTDFEDLHGPGHGDEGRQLCVNHWAHTLKVANPNPLAARGRWGAAEQDILARVHPDLPLVPALTRAQAISPGHYRPK